MPTHIENKSMLEVRDILEKISLDRAVVLWVLLPHIPPTLLHGEELKKFAAFTLAKREGKEGKREGSLLRKCNMYFLQVGRHGGLVADSCHLNMSNYLTNNL